MGNRKDLEIKLNLALDMVNNKNMTVTAACNYVGLTRSTFLRNCVRDIDGSFSLIGASYALQKAMEILQKGKEIKDIDYKDYAISKALEELSSIKLEVK